MPDIQKPVLQAFYFHPPFSNNFWSDILEEVYKKQVYVPYLPTNKEGKICVDIGANVGLTAYYFSQYFEKVYAVEPSEQHLEALNTMILQNKCENIVVIPYAISNENGKVKFYHNTNQTMFSLESVVNDKNDFEEVNTLTIDSLMEKYALDHIDVLKLDCEGSESQVVTSVGFQKVAPKIKAILGEWHNWTQMNQGMFQRTLEELGYTFHWRRDTQAAVFEAVRI
jgi:FkbM family methyltransferase